MIAADGYGLMRRNFQRKGKIYVKQLANNLSLFANKEIKPPKMEGNTNVQRSNKINIIEKDFVVLLTELDKTTPTPERISIRVPGAGGV